MFSNTINFRVEWGETDTAGIIYYPNYYRWFDRATHELFREAGMSVNDFTRQGIVQPLVESGSTYYKPLIYDDPVRLVTTITEVRTKTFRLEHKVYREDTLVCEGYEVRAWVKQIPFEEGGGIKAIPIPPEYLAILKGEPGLEGD